MNKEYIYKHLISSLYKMLCWREEKKKWQTIYDELLAEISNVGPVPILVHSPSEFKYCQV